MKWICTLKHINTYTYSSAKCTHTHPELWRAPTSTQTSDWINPDLFLPSFNSLTDHTHTHTQTRLSASVLHERLTFSVQCKHSINKSLKFGLSPRQQSDTSDSTSILVYTKTAAQKLPAVLFPLGEMSNTWDCRRRQTRPIPNHPLLCELHTERPIP